MRRTLGRWLAALEAAIGALPARRVCWGLVAVFSIWVFFDVMVFRVTGGLANSSFDAMVRARVYTAAPDPRIVIIDIDEASLARMGLEFGRWPWPRDTLATVLAHLERQNPVAVVWDVLFSDADRVNPGGDAAFNQAAEHSTHSHFSVVRLPTANDSASQVTRAALPGLWISVDSPGTPANMGASAGAKSAPVALIPPALPAVAASRLGYNNGYVDDDGMLRRYRFFERLPDGSQIQSIVMSVLSAINKEAYYDQLTGTSGNSGSQNELIAWRSRLQAYPHVSFADVFAVAEGGQPRASVPSFQGKLVIIGATAPSLHDIHPTPLSSMQAGVDSLATVLDNGINQRRLAELPRWLQAALAIALCVGLAVWVQIRSVASLAPALFALPAALVGMSYLSLNGAPFFLDLHLAAALALVFLALLRGWSSLRRNYWCAPLSVSGQPVSIWSWARAQPWFDAPLDRVIDALERHAPQCRIVVADLPAPWPASLRWPELARFLAIVGPSDAVLAARAALEPTLQRLARQSAEPFALEFHPDREELAHAVLCAWAALQKKDTKA